VLIRLVREDLLAKQRLYCRFGDSYSMPKTILSDGTIANVLVRLQEQLVALRLPVLALIPHFANKWLNGCVIGTRARFGPGLVLAHPIGIVINSSVRAGVNLVLESGVVLGDNRGRSPTIGDNVFVGSGAKVIGGVTIGSGARIGANAVVLHDVPPGTLVVGIPARVVPARASADLDPDPDADARAEAEAATSVVPDVVGPEPEPEPVMVRSAGR
jgi:serine O-acetyltransferase